MEYLRELNKLKPGGHYANAVVHGGMIFISGQFAVDPETGERELNKSVEEQARRILDNIALYLEACGSDKDHIVKTTAYLSDLSCWGKVNEVYRDFFGEHTPARSVVPAPELHYGFLIEIEAIAMVKDRQSEE